MVTIGSPFFEGFRSVSNQFMGTGFLSNSNSWGQVFYREPQIHGDRFSIEFMGTGFLLRSVEIHGDKIHKIHGDRLSIEIRTKFMGTGYLLRSAKFMGTQNSWGQVIY